MSLNNLNQQTPVDLIGTFFMGKVVDNNDPEKMERVKCTIDNMYQGEAADLPWISPAVGRMFGNNGTFGTQSVPRVGTKLWVVMQNGDPHHPVYLGGLLDKSSVADLGNYPERYGFIDAINNKFYIDQSDGTVKFEHFSGTSFTIDPSGKITINCVDQIDVTASSTINVTARGNINVDSSSQVNVTAPQINLN